MRRRLNRLAIFAVLLLLGTARALHAQDSLFVHFAALDVIPDAENRLAAIAAELDNPADAAAVADAAQRFQAFTREAGGGLIGAADGSEVWAGNWIRQLSDSRRRTLSAAMQALDGAAAQQAFDDVRNNSAVDPIDAYSIARRYPLMSVATDALKFASDQSRLIGDGASADAFEALAQNHTPTAPMSAGQRLPFAAPWFGPPLRSAWTAMRSWPMVAGGITFVVGPTQVVALNDQSMLWHGPLGEDAPAGAGSANPSGFTRGPAFVPAFFCVDDHAPAIVVVRQPYSRGNGWAIRAMRGGDGKLLWTTETRSELTRLIFASTPVVAGRYVYAVAGDPGDDLDRIVIIALELTTGRQLWRCDLGSVSHPTPLKHSRPTDANTTTEPYRPWLNESAPAVSGDTVIVAPDVGVVAAVDRFDGTLHWLHPYTPLGLPITEAHRSILEAAVAARAAQQNHRPGDPSGLPTRWNNTPAIAEQTAVVAPQDSGSVFGLDIPTGRLLWETVQIPALNPGKLDSPIESLAPFTLVGIRDRTAMLQGASLIGLTLDKGEIASRTDRLTNITGPATLNGKLLIAPGREHSAVSYAELNGAASTSSAMFNELLRIDAIRKALQSNDSLSCFTLPK